jgi:1-acyl-sn-glycerol-3-phosphate acyltransferase
MLKRLAAGILRLLGWQIDARLPPQPKYVMVGAPHTSNWDFPLTLIVLTALGLRFSWVGKHTLFRWPFGFLFRSLGGIPVNRTLRLTFIQQMVAFFQTQDRMVLAIAPEGTRKKTSYWKTGFYVIAVEAQIPIALGYIDYSRKKLGIGKTIIPTGDIHADFVRIQEFYKDITGLHPHKQGAIVLKDQQKR